MRKIKGGAASQYKGRKKNLRKNAEQQGPYLEKNNVTILDESFSLRNGILNGQKLLHRIQRWRRHHLNIINRLSLATKSRENHENRNKDECQSKCVTQPSPEMHAVIYQKKISTSLMHSGNPEKKHPKKPQSHTLPCSSHMRVCRKNLNN